MTAWQRWQKHKFEKDERFQSVILGKIGCYTEKERGSVTKHIQISTQDVFKISMIKSSRRKHLENAARVIHLQCLSE